MWKFAPVKLQGYCKIGARLLQGWRDRMADIKNFYFIKGRFRNEQVCN